MGTGNAHSSMCLGRALKLPVSPVHTKVFSVSCREGSSSLVHVCIANAPVLRPQFASALILCPVSCSEPGQTYFPVSLLQICDFIDAEPRPIWHKAGARDRRALLGVFMNVLGAQHSPVDEVDATLWLWGWWLCGKSGTALV